MLLVKYKLVTLREIRSFPVFTNDCRRRPVRLLLLSGVLIDGLLNSSHLVPGRNQHLLYLPSRHTMLFQILDLQTELWTSRQPRMIDWLPFRLVLLKVLLHPLHHDRVPLDIPKQGLMGLVREDRLSIHRIVYFHMQGIHKGAVHVIILALSLRSWWGIQWHHGCLHLLPLFHF